MKDRRFRISVAVLAGLAVLYFGSGGASAGQERQISSGVVVLARSSRQPPSTTSPDRSDSGTPVS